MASPFGQSAAGPPAVAPRPGGGGRWPRPTDAHPRSDRSAIARRLALADLVEGLAHDLKNQLTVVAASVQLARRGGADAPAAELLDRAFLAAMRAASMLDDMMSYTHASATPPPAVADVGQALETAVAAAWSYCAGHRVGVEMCPDPGLPRVHASEAVLRVLFWRLLCFTVAAGRPGLRLVVAAQASEGQVVLRMRLRPSGTGMMPAAQGAGVEETAAAWPPPDRRDGPAHEALAAQDVRAAYSHWGTLGGDADEQAVLLALAGQAGAELHWEADGPVLAMTPVKAANSG